MIENIIYTTLQQYNTNWGTGILLYKAGKLLVAPRKDNNLWGSVGGKVEIGETPIQAAVRECKEESNIQIYNMSFLGTIEHNSPNGKNWLSFVFLSTDFDDSIVKNQVSEMGQFEWLSIDELNKRELFPPFKQSLELAIQLNKLNDNSIGYIVAPDKPSKVEDMYHCAYSYVPVQQEFNPWKELPPWYSWD